MAIIYIDESGSMTTQSCANQPYFIISCIKINNKRKAKSAFKRFVSRNFKELQKCDKHCAMFNNGKFLEIKGSSLKPYLKIDFVNSFCIENIIEIYYIIVDNSKIMSSFYENTARAFNYIIRLALAYFIKKQLLPEENYNIFIDERNVKTNTKFFLQEYLATALCVEENLLNNYNIQVCYEDSCNNEMIQVADVFANFCYSQLRTNNYSDLFNELISDNYIRIFRFPKK